jgi:hypothetical protein
MNRKGSVLLTLLLVVAVLLVGGGIWYWYTQRPSLPTAQIPTTSPAISPTSSPVVSNPIQTSSTWTSYSNSSVGISFSYPANWTSELNANNSVVEGNTPPQNMVSTFSMNLLPPNWGTNPSGVAIQISSFYLNNSTNQPIPTQMAAICAYYQIKNCVPLKNKNGVEFIQNNYDEGMHGYEILDLIPTGKDIIGFDLQTGGPEAQTLSQIIDTIELQ